MKEIIFFSNNKNKINEVSKILSSDLYTVLSLDDFKKIVSPKEVGKTFEENAKIKSLYGFNKFNRMSFADDSGICINAMNNAPGINSKEYLKKNKDAKKIFKEIISTSKHKNNFKAYFQTTICLTLSKNKHIFFNGKIKGRIAENIKGSNGFGYDPIFIPDGQDQTFAEMSIIKKNQISHRSIAIKKLHKYFIKT